MCTKYRKECFLKDHINNVSSKVKNACTYQYKLQEYTYKI